nr:MAG TPA: hypothetical protein [Bacteriophage sp.]
MYHTSSLKPSLFYPFGSNPSLTSLSNELLLISRYR